ncbi:leucine-rich repeat-containing protein 18 [Lampris incognitus]|uniref:leucine-rich repeat-containing protein 18 n=1 Tax=Lampris incognitus TaxID=2546036 RepID=UPI0024B4A1D7|nr:leucine-rich repeat-containing protein 18 [Lampris incognitus]
MAKGEQARGKRVTLKMAKRAVRLMPDGRRRLNLSNMGITAFPRCVLKLPDVVELDLSRNAIRELPDDVGAFASLVWLDLHSNKLEAVPESIGRLEGLTHLNLSNNRLTSSGLPPTLGSLTHLRSLNLGMNRLDTLPPTMVALTGLQELGLFDNLFAALPEFVRVLTCLTKLNTERNPLSYSQQDASGEPHEKLGFEENFYFCKESRLCKTCLERCREDSERQKRAMRGEGERGGRVLEEKRKRMYSGLSTPNSVAKANQDVWRRVEERH